MGLHIDSLNDLKKLLKQFKLEVKSVEELQALLAKLNAEENTDEARLRGAWRLIGTVAKFSFVSAGILSFYGIIMPSAMSRELGGNAALLTVLILGILWGGATLTTVVTAVVILRSLRRYPAESRARPPQGTESVGGRNATAGTEHAPTTVTNELTRITPPRNSA